MAELKWSETKNARLKKVRGVSFEEILKADLIAVKIHPSKDFQQITGPDEIVKISPGSLKHWLKCAF